MKKPQMIYFNARAIIERIVNGEKMVLIQQRSDGKFFEFPGGCMEEDETFKRSNGLHRKS
jgi:8-oxo-dGTP pyrophosphatase MutT (NUDIX family)